MIGRVKSKNEKEDSHGWHNKARKKVKKTLIAKMVIEKEQRMKEKEKDSHGWNDGEKSKQEKKHSWPRWLWEKKKKRGKRKRKDRIVKMTMRREKY